MNAESQPAAFYFYATAGTNPGADPTARMTFNLKEEMFNEAPQSLKGAGDLPEIAFHLDGEVTELSYLELKNILLAHRLAKTRENSKELTEADTPAIMLFSTPEQATLQIVATQVGVDAERARASTIYDDFWKRVGSRNWDGYQEPKMPTEFRLHLNGTCRKLSFEQLREVTEPFIASPVNESSPT